MKNVCLILQLEGIRKKYGQLSKKRIKEDIEANGGISPWSIHNLFDKCPCERCKEERIKNGN